MDDDLLRKVEQSGSVGLDGSCGCFTCRDAAAEMRRLRAAEDAACLEAERHRREIERMAEERHLLHSSLGKGDRFWGCSRGPCRRASQYLRGLTPPAPPTAGDNADNDNAE